MKKLLLTEAELDRKIDSFLNRKFEAANIKRIEKKQTSYSVSAWKQYAI